jgi:ribose/xylose/arabinose/galactoside ABC-type transport system permease subunit
MDQLKDNLKLNKNNGVFVILAILLVISGFYNPDFVKPDNLMVMLRQASALGIVTLGQLFVIVGGGVDLSVAATMQMSITIFMVGYNLYGMTGLAVGVVLALLFGVLIGLINGLIITKYNVQPFLTTLFTASIVTGIRMIATGIKPAGDIPDIIRVLGRDRTFNIPNALIIFMLVALVAYIILNKSVFGRKLITVGTNSTAAKYSGIKVDRIIIQSYVACGLLAVLAAMVLAGYIGFADQWIGSGYNLNSLVAAVIGGNYLGGGRGSVTGVIGGALTMTFVINFVTLLGFTAPFQYVVSGMVLILALLIGVATSKK